MKRYIVVVTLVVALIAVTAAFAVMPSQHADMQAGEGQLLAVHTFYLGSNYTPPECPLPVGNGCGGW